MSEEFVGHPDAVGDESGALDSEPSEVMDEDRLEADPLEDGMDPGERYSRDLRLGGTREAEERDNLAERLPQEEPDVGAEEPPGRPVAATPAMELDESVDDPRTTGDVPDDSPAVGGGLELGAGDAVEPTGDSADDRVADAATLDNETHSGDPEAQALHVEPER